MSSERQSIIKIGVNSAKEGKCYGKARREVIICPKNIYENYIRPYA